MAIEIPGTPEKAASEKIGGEHYQLLKVCLGDYGVNDGSLSSANPLPITGSLTDITGTISLPTGAATQATLAALNDKVVAVDTGAVVVSSGTITGITNAVAVTGTFWQATQPVSGPLTDAQLRATAVPVSTGTVAVTGTFWQATQPVSGTFWQATQPVSGTFWQATQPVSGTFWQATQPVSGTVTDGGAGKTLKSASFSLTATGTVVSAVGGKRLKVYAIKLVVSAAISVNFRDGGATALEGAQSLAANGGFVESLNPPAFLFGTTAVNSLDLVISGTGTAAGRVSYWDDDGA